MYYVVSLAVTNARTHHKSRDNLDRIAVMPPVIRELFHLRFYWPFYLLLFSASWLGMAPMIDTHHTHRWLMWGICKSMVFEHWNSDMCQLCYHSWFMLSKKYCGMKRNTVLDFKITQAQIGDIRERFFTPPRESTRSQVVYTTLSEKSRVRTPRSMHIFEVARNVFSSPSPTSVKTVDSTDLKLFPPSGSYECLLDKLKMRLI